MSHLPVAVRSALRRLARRLAIGLFLDVWPTWAAGSLLLAGVAALVCRLLVPAAASGLPWLWLAPIGAAIPAAVVCAVRAYRPAQVVAIADSLAGGDGLLLALAERPDSSWAASPLLERVASLPLPQLRPWRKLATLVPALAFLLAALLLPQRQQAREAQTVLANQVVNDLAATVVALKKEELITAEEAQKLEEEIERIRKGASERVDSSSWEAADALKERVAADVAEKRDALKWTQESLARYAAAAQAGANDPSSKDALAAGEGAELMKALGKLAESGLLSNAPAGLKALAAGRAALPTDAESLRKLQASLAEFLDGQSAKFGELTALGREFGRFDPQEFPLGGNSDNVDDGLPGNGGVNRGRADAPLTWGKESLPFDRFKAQPLPPGHVRSPDDWAPLVVMPGAPSELPQSSTASAARTYAGGAGQEAWRRTLAPRHQSAVRKYFEK